MTRRIVCALMLAALAGCSSDGKVREPAELQDIVNPKIKPKTVWTARAGVGSDDYHSALIPAVETDAVFVADVRGRVYAYDPRDGSRIWQTQTDARVISGPTVSGNAIFLGTMDGEVIALKRADAMLASDPNNIAITVYSVYALAALGERERAKARMDRALLIDPDNFNLSYNFACAMCVHLQDAEAALGMLKPVFEKITETFLPYAKADPDFDLLRDDPRYQAMVDAAEARLAEAQGGTESSQAG